MLGAQPPHQLPDDDAQLAGERGGAWHACSIYEGKL
jgi:hypothetical protein